MKNIKKLKSISLFDLTIFSTLALVFALVAGLLIMAVASSNAHKDEKCVDSHYQITRVGKGSTTIKVCDKWVAK